MLRFAIPLVTIGTDLLSQKFLVADYALSQRAIESSSGQAAMLNPPVATAPDVQGTWDKVKDWIAKSADVKTHFEELKKTAEQAIEHIVKIMVIFMLQTLLIPLLLLWGLYGVLRRAFELPGRNTNVVAG